MKYKILKECKFSPKGFDIKELKVGDVVELPDSIGKPFSAKSLCEEYDPDAEREKEEALEREEAAAKKEAQDLIDAEAREKEEAAEKIKAEAAKAKKSRSKEA